MMNYSTAPAAAQFDDKTGFCIQAGWTTIYNTDAAGEYAGANYEYVPLGVSLPAGAYADEPQLPAEGKALRRSSDGQKWEHVTDLRGKTAYQTDNGQPVTISDIGDLPAGLTLTAPKTQFDKWDGRKWVTDKDAQQAAMVAAATAQKSQLLAEADSTIHDLQEAINLNMAQDGDSEKLDAWRRYRVTLTRVDVEGAEWPEVPTT
ncbi:MAG: tail fiber assembly protein [Enterobacteriaceae bacterium]